MRARRLVLAALALLFAGPANATKDQYGIWLSTTTGGALGEPATTPWLWSLEGQYRRFDTFDGTRQVIARGFVGARLGGGWRAGMRYGHFYSDADQLDSFHENRFSPVAEWTAEGPGTATLRLRSIAEFRSVQERSGTAVRFRLRVRLDWPMRSLDDASWVASLEPLFDLRDVDWAEQGWNQNRLFLGARLPLSPQTSFEIGYLNVWANPLDRGNLVTHTVFAQLRF